MLLAGILTVYATRNVVVGPDLRTVAECGVFGAALSLAVSAFVACVAQIVSANAARIAARVLLLALLTAFFLYSRWLPDIALRGAALLTGAAIVLLMLRRQQA
jgi:ABC-type enterochelin transport system permease subunit